MELFDYFINVLIQNVDYHISDIELINIRWSLMNAVEFNQYMILENCDRKFCGFMTWEIRNNSNKEDMIDLGINNLVIIKSARGTYNLMRSVNILRSKYPNVASFVWHNRKHNEVYEFRQRGYYEAMEKSI